MLQEFLCGKLLKKDYEKAAAQQAERERQEKEEEKERRRLAAEERARRLEEEKQNKGRKKKAEKKPAEEEEKIPGAVKEASRVGMRQYARGRAYDPYRYSAEGPTAYPGAALFSRRRKTPGRWRRSPTNWNRSLWSRPPTKRLWRLSGRSRPAPPLRG